MDVHNYYDDSNKQSIEQYGRRLVGHTFREVVLYGADIYKRSASFVYEKQEELLSVSYDDKKRKGGLGNLIEELYFGYKANSNPEPDFPKAGVELKLSPYQIKKNGYLKAGERLVLTMIAHDKPVDEDLYTSHLWNKCQLLLLIYYYRDRSLKDKLNYRIDFVSLFTPPEVDMEIIKQDYKIITDKIKAGLAHKLSEGDTIYLGACTKGSTAEKSTVPQFYYPYAKARRRAFCYKIQYMTYVLNNYLAKNAITYDHIIDNPSDLKGKSFEKIITDKINQYKGVTDIELCSIFGEKYTGNKSQWVTLGYRMLGVKSSRAEEFIKAGISIKAVRISNKGKLDENSPLPTFKFMDLKDETWEDSTLYNYLCTRKFLFIVFKQIGDLYILRGCQLWNMPYDDISIVESEWSAIKDTAVQGIKFTMKNTSKGIVVNNNLPKKKGSKIIHIRPHKSHTYYQFSDGTVVGKGTISDSDLLPDGQRMTVQSFWLNKEYLFSQLNDNLKG